MRVLPALFARLILLAVQLLVVGQRLAQIARLVHNQVFLGLEVLPAFHAVVRHPGDAIPGGGAAETERTVLLFVEGVLGLDDLGTVVVGECSVNSFDSC